MRWPWRVFRLLARRFVPSEVQSEGLLTMIPTVYGLPKNCAMLQILVMMTNGPNPGCTPSMMMTAARSHYLFWW